MIRLPIIIKEFIRRHFAVFLLRHNPSRKRRTCSQTRIIATLFIIGFFIFSSTPARAASRIVRVGVFPAAPLVFINDGKPDGLFINIIEHFAIALNWKIQYVEDTWDNLLIRLKTGDIDLLPAVGFNNARTANYDFTRNPVFIDSGVLYASPNITLHTIFNLQGKRVAAVKGSLFTKGFIDYVSSFGVTCNMVYTKDNPAVMKAIEEGTVDAGVCIYSLGSVLSKNYKIEITPISFSPVALEFAVPKGKNADIVTGIDQLLSPMIADKKSIYNQLFKKWTNPPVSKEIPSWIVWVTSGIIFIGLILGIHNIILKKQVAVKTKNLLEEITERITAEEKLKLTLSEKETLLRELYHRTKNTMQIICSLLSLQASIYPEDKPIRKLVKNSNDRIQAISLVHQMLYSSNNLSHISISDYVKELSFLIMKSFEISKSRINITLNISEGYFLLDAAIPIGLVLNELLTNSLKYAFPDNRKGNIAIDIRTENQGICHLTYSDDGVGVPDGFNFEEQNSLGFKLINTLCRFQMQGKNSYENKNGISFSAELSINLYKPRV
jgi:two-component sensor histidine kinase/ABC-type amino acid transport substrate-binding protein